jgi:hypothetical protein
MHGAMHLPPERLGRLAECSRQGDYDRKFLSAEFSSEVRAGRANTQVCDKASPARGVMLHLRACHASKAAILTIPAFRVPVENRSPA